MSPNRIKGLSINILIYFSFLVEALDFVNMGI